MRFPAVFSAPPVSIRRARAHPNRVGGSSWRPRLITGPADVPYAERIGRVLSDWALLAGQGSTFAEDPRTRWLREELERPASEPARVDRGHLCADRSPVEFCERINAQPQRVAFTFEPGPPAEDGDPAAGPLCRWPGPVAGGMEAELAAWRRQPGGKAEGRRQKAEGSAERKTGFLARKPLSTQAGHRSTGSHAAWIGVDYAHPVGIRVYVSLRGEPSSGRTPDQEPGLAGLPLQDGARRALEELHRRGRLRVVGIDCGGERKRTKLAFAHPVDPAALEALATHAGIPAAPTRAYLRMLSPSGAGWRQRRCGIGIAIDATGGVLGYTVYHYTAPYFRDDEELRSFVLRLAGHFSWDTTVYRPASRLLDVAGKRVRTLLGFTIAETGETSLRLYGRSGACV